MKTTAFRIIVTVVTAICAALAIWIGTIPASVTATPYQHSAQHVLAGSQGQCGDGCTWGGPAR
jgi:hypothetical protein